MTAQRRVVVVSSPGAGPSLHWSHAVAASLHASLVANGADVEWVPVLRAGQSLPAGPHAAALTVPPVPALSRVGPDNRHLEVETALTRMLRRVPAPSFVHVGTGARGSTNLCWLADRLGSAAFAVARAAEVVCHRGDLVHASGETCREFLDPERCAHCCTTPSSGRAPPDDLHARSDLLAASLLAATVVFVPSPDDAALLATFGVTRRQLEVTHDAAAIAARVLR